MFKPNGPYHERWSSIRGSPIFQEVLSPYSTLSFRNPRLGRSLLKVLGCNNFLPGKNKGELSEISKEPYSNMENHVECLRRPHESAPYL